MIVIGVTGTNGAGKGAVVDYLVQQKGFTHYSVRLVLVELLEERNLPIDRPRMGQLGDELRQNHGAGYFITRFTEEMKESGIERGAIESIRSVGEARFLEEQNGTLIAVDADQHTRYKRIVARQSETDKIDFQTFVEQEENEWKAQTDTGMNIPKVMSMADYTIMNEGTLEELHAQIDKILEKVDAKTRK